MQKKDIVLGEHYAYADHKWATPHEVEVVSLDAPVKQGYSYSRRTVSGVMVQRTDGPQKGKPFTTTGRNLVRTWAEQEEMQRVAKEHATAAHKAEVELFARRAGQAVQIETLLEAHGEPTRPNGISIYRENARAAVKAAGFEEVDGLYSGKSYLARFDLSEWMLNGRLDEKTVTVLLADSRLSLKGV